MIEIPVLPVEKDNIDLQPDYFEVNINGKLLIFKFYWNPNDKYFSFDVYDNKLNPIILGRKIVIGSDMLGRAYNDSLPNIYLVPLPLTREAQSSGITFDNFLEDVKIYILEKGGE
jgi:hypothetical protein